MNRSNPKAEQQAGKGQGFKPHCRFRADTDKDNIHFLVWGPLTLSWKPSPKNNAIEVPRDVILSWSLGSNADKHNVYFGIDVNSINEASIDNSLDVLFSQNQDANTYDPDGLLDYGQTYY